MMNGFEKRAQEKKKQIVEAAFNLMSTSSGVTNLNIAEVAKQANVGKTTIFKYFGNKDNLIHEVFKQFLEQIGVTAKEIMAKNKPFEETMILISHNKIQHFSKVSKQFYLDLMHYFTEKINDDDSSLMREYTKENFSMMLDLFHRGRKEGKVDLKYSDEFLMLYFQAMIEGISNPEIYSRIVPYTDVMTEMLLKSIAPNK